MRGVDGLYLLVVLRKAMHARHGWIGRSWSVGGRVSGFDMNAQDRARRTPKFEFMRVRGRRIGLVNSWLRVSLL